MSAKISVIIPIYNVKQYIEASLRSVCTQTFKDYEIILINDGTKDDSMEIASRVMKNYSIPYKFINKENGGLPSARNVGIQEATGEYICFIDSDDIIAKNHLGDLWECCKKYQVQAAYALFQLTYESNRNGKPTSNNESRKIKHDELIQNFLIRKIKIHCCSLLVKRQFLLEKEYLFNEKLRYGEDIDFMWRLFLELDAIGCTENETYMYLQRNNSLMTEQNVDRVLSLMAEFRDTVDKLMEKYPNDRGVLKYLYGKASLAFYRTFAESSSYNLFLTLLSKTQYKKNIRVVLGINDIKIKILALSLLMSPRLFTRIVKRNRETLGERR